MKIACIFGSTGLVGTSLKEQLLNDERYSKVILFVRSELMLTHPKLIQVVGDYNKLEGYSEQLVADEYYCCLGTTMKKAKTKEAFEYVDYQLPVKISQLAVNSSVNKYCVVSSIGASAKSSNFYLHTKGKMEDDILATGIDHLHFFRPSLLLGYRNEKRFGESMAKVFAKLFGFLMIGKLKKYRAIQAKTVANAMIKVANKNTNQRVFISDEIQKIGALTGAATKLRN
jgi:uncharacterized protein YbjT (DUF2867 family)